MKSTVSIFLVALVLSPCVSSADDLVRLSSLASIFSEQVDLANSTGRAPGPPHSIFFERLLEELEHLQIPQSTILFWLSSDGRLHCSVHLIAPRNVVHSVLGRSPPSA